MKKILFLLITLFIVSSSFAQSRKLLESKRKRLKKDIKKIERILSQTRREKENVLEDLKDYDDKLNVRDKLIKTIEEETDSIQTSITKNEYTIKKNQEELVLLKNDYSKLIYKAYKSRSKQSKALFILSSKDFHQAYKRLSYINSYKLFTKNQGLSIIGKTDLIKQLNDSLGIIKNQNLALINEKQEETDLILKEKGAREKIVKRIKRQERKYHVKLKEKLKEDRKISQKINEIIANAIRSANKKKKSTSKKLVLTTDEMILKEKFEQNKGKLPAPVQSGYVTRKFGVQSHPTFKKIKINSTGIHVRCKKGDDAKAIFTGKVLVVQLLSKGRKSVFIQHGSYITAYTNLERVFVKKGAKVKTGQSIGRVHTDNVTGKTTLQFVLSKNTTRLDPLNWLKI